MKGNIANLNMQIWSIPMSDEERKKWKTEEDICPACQEKFGGYKQVKTGRNMFINSSVPLGTIIHKKCCQK